MERQTELTESSLDIESPSRRFTLHTANRALVLVRKIVADLVTEYARVLEFQEIVELEQSYGGPDGADHLHGDFRNAVDRVRGYVRELEGVGAELRDFERGQIDFPARVNGRDICFCWQLDEDHIQFWHEPGGSLCIRRPLCELLSATGV